MSETKKKGHYEIYDDRTSHDIEAIIYTIDREMKCQHAHLSRDKVARNH